MKAKRRQFRTERGRCSVCRRPVTVVVLSTTSKVAEQHPLPTFTTVKKTGEVIREGDLLGCRGSGAVALDIFAEGPS